MSAQVIRLRDPATGELRTLGFDQALDMLPATMRRRSESRERLWPLWVSHSKMAGGEDRLLEGLDLYIRRDPDLPRTGGPGLQVWLRSRRYEFWLAEADKLRALPPKIPKRFNDERLRLSFHERFTDPRARAWLDGCELDGDTLVMGKGARLEWIEGPFRGWALANGIGGYRSRT
jgi:hypothetical protein